jgi:hypothetical protein
VAGRPLFLTTPPMRGEDVRALQRALQSPQRPDLAGIDFLRSDVDGAFGENTHRAVYRAKYWLGYAKPDHRAGDLLVAFLNGTAAPTPAMTANRKKRLAAATNEPRGLAKVREAVKHIGLTENPPGSNIVLFSTWYGFVGPWCAMFVTYCGCKAGLPAYARRRRWSYVPFMIEDARAGRFHYALTNEPVTGDDVAFEWPPNDGVADHVGIYASEPDLQQIAPAALRAAREQFGTLGPGEFWSIEGNAVLGADSRGGAVLIRKRNRRSACAVMHPGSR